MYSGTSMAASVPATFVTGNSGNDGFLGGGGGIGAILIGALLSGGGLFGGLGNRGAVAAGADVAATAALSQQVQTLSGQVSNNAIQGEINELESSLNSLGLSTMMGIKDNGNLYLQGTGSILQGQAQNNFQTLNSLNGAVGTITTQNYNAALQQLNSFNQLNTTTLQSFNEMSRDNGNSFNAIQATLQLQNMQAAQCCCDIKGAIRTDGDLTRALINDLNVQSLTAQLNDAKAALSNANQTTTILNAIRRSENTTIAV